MDEALLIEELQAWGESQPFWQWRGPAPEDYLEGWYQAYVFGDKTGRRAVDHLPYSSLYDLYLLWDKENEKIDISVVESGKDGALVAETTVKGIGVSSTLEMAQQEAYKFGEKYLSESLKQLDKSIETSLSNLFQRIDEHFLLKSTANESTNFNYQLLSQWGDYPSLKVDIWVQKGTARKGLCQVITHLEERSSPGLFTTVVIDKYATTNKSTLVDEVVHRLDALHEHYQTFRHNELPPKFHVFLPERWGWKVEVASDRTRYFTQGDREVTVKFNVGKRADSKPLLIVEQDGTGTKIHEVENTTEGTKLLARLIDVLPDADKDWPAERFWTIDDEKQKPPALDTVSPGEASPGDATLGLEDKTEMLSRIDQKRFSWVSVSIPEMLDTVGYSIVKFVVFETNKDQVEHIVDNYFSIHFPELIKASSATNKGYSFVGIYPRNYLKNAREAVAKNQVVPYFLPTDSVMLSGAKKWYEDAYPSKTAEDEPSAAQVQAAAVPPASTPGRRAVDRDDPEAMKNIANFDRGQGANQQAGGAATDQKATLNNNTTSQWIISGRLIKVGPEFTRDGLQRNYLYIYPEKTMDKGEDKDLPTKIVNDIVYRDATPSEVDQYLETRTIPADVVEKKKYGNKLDLSKYETPGTRLASHGRLGKPASAFTNTDPFNLKGLEKRKWYMDEGLLRAEYQGYDGNVTLDIREGTDKLTYKLTDEGGIVNNGFVDTTHAGSGAVNTFRDLSMLAERYAKGRQSTPTAKTKETGRVAVPGGSVDRWTNDNYYTQHPQHVHDEFYRKSGRHGEVTSVRLSENNSLTESLSRIDVQGAQLPSESVSARITATVTTSANSEPTAIDADNLERAVRKNTQEIATKSKAKTKRTARRSRRIVPVHRGRGGNRAQPATQISHPEEQVAVRPASYVAKHFNPGLSEDDFRIYAHYQRLLGTPLKGYYASLPTPTHEELVAWVDQGKLFYENNILMPDYFYLSGDLYERQQRFERERADIAQQWGEDVAQRQHEALTSALQGHLRKRLMLDPNLPEGERLQLELLSKVSDTFRVKGLNSLDELTSQRVGQKYSISVQRDEQTGDSLSLKDAFMLWLTTQKENITVKFGLTVEDLINIHIYRMRMPSGEDKSVWSATKARCKKEADRLFAHFLVEELTDEDRTRLEATWNREYFAEAPLDYRRVPIAFPIAETYRDVEVDIRPEKRDAVTFLTTAGSGCLAYEVGHGKTWASIFSIAAFIEMGRCTRALLVVPNAVYKQFLSELKGLAPHLTALEYYNLDAAHLEYARANKPGPNSVTIMTYEGFRKVGFNEETEAVLGAELDKVLQQGIDARTAKAMQAANAKVSKIQGKALRYTEIEIEDFGWDFLCVDEAHSMKKVFTGVKGEVAEDGNRESQQYEVSGGAPSALATKGFMIAQYIQRKNRYGNVLLLTATPFTNSPLEVYSMLSLVGYKGLQQAKLENIKRFYDNYVEVDSRLVINAKFEPQRKQIVTGFRNLRALQSLLYRYFDRKDIPLTSNKRPAKWVLPLRTKLVDGEFVAVPKAEQVEPILPLSAEQTEIMEAIKAYAGGKLDFEQLCTGFGTTDAQEDEADDIDSGVDALTPGELINMNSLSKEEQAGVRLLRSMNLSRNVALSPYLHLCTNLGPLTYRSYVESSPKLNYVMQCIKSVKEHHEAKKEAVSGQVIYMDRGVDNFKLLKEYLVKVIGYQEHEVGIMRSNMAGVKPKGVRTADAKDYVKNLFLGQRWNADTKEFDPIPDSERIKVVIGTSTIKEGVNLQKYGTVLYNCFVDWNPTDNIQLEGRIWRQGNLFKHVRIVNVLMEDSADVFLFQKLEEKTGRINQLWNRDGNTNTFNLDEFNPEELKYTLISDPSVIAELEIQEEKGRYEDEKLSVNSELKRLEWIEAVFNQMKKYPQLIKDQFAEHLLTYEGIPQDPFKANEYLVSRFRSVVRNQKLPVDGNLDTPVQSWVSREEYYTVGKGMEHPRASYYRYTQIKPQWFASYARYSRAADRLLLTYLQPKGLTLDDLPGLRDKFLNELEGLQKRQTELSSPEAIESRLRTIEAQRQRSAIESRNLPERVEQFKTLNYLLDERRQAVAEKVITPATPEGIRKAIKGLVALEKYATGEQKEQASKAVRGLRALLKYLPRAA